MPIVNSTWEATTQIDGSKNVVMRFFDQDGNSYVISGHYGALVDIQTIVNNRATELSEQLAQAEFEQIVGL